MNELRSDSSFESAVHRQPNARAERLFRSPSTTTAAASAFVAAVALWVVIAVILTGIARNEQNTLLDGVQTTASTVSRLLAGYSDRLLINADLVRHIAAEVVGLEGPMEVDRAAYDSLRRMIDISPDIVSVWVGDAEGTAVLTTREYPAPALSAADREYYTTVRDNPDRLFVGNLIDNRYPAEALLINTSRRLSEPDGEMRGFVQVSLDPIVLSQVFREVNLGFDASLWWIGPDGRPLIREPALPAARLENLVPPEFRSWPLRTPNEAQDQSPILSVSNVDGEKRLIFWSDAPVHGSRIIVGVSYEELAARWRAQLYPSILFGLALGIAGTLIIWLLHRSRSRSVAYTAQLEREVDERTVELDLALQQKNLMLRELDHRSRNTFATILALTRQLLRSSDTLEAFREKFSDRLQALAHTHLTFINSENQDRAQIADLARVALSPYPLLEEQIDIAGPPAELSSVQTFAVGLILHELVTNSVKYGSLSAPDGAVSVKWTLDADSINLTWQEIGGPNVRAPESHGSGTDVIDRAARMMGGKIDRDFAPAGVRVSLMIPKSPAR